MDAEGAEMTDNMIAEVLIEACSAGHVHLSLVEAGDDCMCLHGIFTPQEAFDLAQLLLKAAAEAHDVLRNSRNTGPCTLH
jgi:hypothetical protein